MDKDLLDACKFLLSFVPEWARKSHKGLDPTFYGTLTYQGDLEVIRKVDAIRKLVADKEDEHGGG